MPTPSIAYLVIKLHHLGLPWDFPVWQDIVKVQHGLFPSDPRHYPPGWTADDVKNVKSFFDQCQAKATEEDRMAFVSQTRGAALPGRKKWKSWITALWKSARIHERIIAVLAANNCHPLSLAAEQGTDAGTWPAGGLWIPTCVDAVAFDLFGTEGVDNHGRLREGYRPTLQHLIQRTWTYLTKRLERAEKRIAICEEDALKAFNALDDTPSRAKVSAVIRAVARWRNVAELLNTPENLEKIEEIEAELDRLMEGLGAKVSDAKKKKSSAPKLFKLSKDMLKSLASEEAVQDVIALYHEHFDNPSNVADDIPILEPQRALQNPFGTPDIGVEYEAQMTPNQLATNLGFDNGLPITFNRLRRTDGLTNWKSPQSFIYRGKAPAEIENLELHWHQLAGVHAIIRMCFQEKAESSDYCIGVLVADEVGLGKTYQAATVIAFLAEAEMRQRRGYPMPPLLNKRPYMGDTTKIANEPHLIIVPGTLIAQWLAELHILFKPQHVDIFIYPTGAEERAMFWSREGPFNSSNHSRSSRIILVPHTVLRMEYKTLHKTAKHYGAAPWTSNDLYRHVTQSDIDKTLYGHSYLSITLDEAHHFRNHGVKHSAALEMLDTAVIRLVLSATPLQTATKDLAAMGRLTGIPHFLSDDAWEEEKEDLRTLRRAREVKDSSDDKTPLEEDEDPVKACQIAIAQRMNRQSQGHVLRRSVKSLNWLGAALVSLPPCETIHAYLDLTPREINIITANGQALKETVGAANMASKLFTRGFYMEYRTSVVYARENSDDELPVFKSLDEWLPVKSTKVDTAARLCRYLLTRDDLPPPEFKDGTMHIPNIPTVRDYQNATQDLKIVVFAEFPSMISLFQNVFELYGIKVLALNGSLAYDKRAEVVNRFREDPSLRVLAVSSVGTTGINLAFCRVVIFLDQPWSAQDVRQMTGRVHRQPQKHKVHCYHLIANDTADILVSEMAQGKEGMMEAYLSKPAGKDMYDLLSGGNADPSVDLDEDDEPPKPKAKKASKKKRVQAVVDPAEEEDEEEEVAASIAPKERHRKSKSKAKSKELVEDSDDDEGDAPPPKPSKRKPAMEKTPSASVVARKAQTKSNSIAQKMDSNVSASQASRKAPKATRKHVVDDDDSAPPPPPPHNDSAPSRPKKAKGKGKLAVENVSAPPPPKGKANSKSVVNENVDRAPPPPPLNAYAKSNPASKGGPKPVAESDADVAPAPPPRNKTKANLIAKGRDAETAPAKKGKKHQLPPPPAADSSDDDQSRPPPPPKGKSKAKPANDAPDSKAQSNKNKHADDGGDDDGDGGDGGGYDDGGDDEDDDGGDDEEPKGRGGDEDNEREEDGEEDEEDEEADVSQAQADAMDVDDDHDDDDIYAPDPPASGHEDYDPSELDVPNQSEVSSRASLRSRTSASDVSMGSQSDNSMRSFAPEIRGVSPPPQIDVPTPPQFYAIGKRPHGRRTPTSPTDEHLLRRRQSQGSNVGRNDEHRVDLRQAFNGMDRPLNRVKSMPLKGSMYSASQPSHSMQKPGPLLKPRSSQPLIERAKHVPDESEAFKRRKLLTTGQTSTESSERAQRDPARTLDQLQGYSRRAPNAVSGPSSSSTSLLRHASNAASGPSSASTSNAGLSGRDSSGDTSIPLHRHPALFEKRAITPPAALPPKKLNPFGAGSYYKPAPKKGGKK